jgi:hypothetical protein
MFNAFHKPIAPRITADFSRLESGVWDVFERELREHLVQIGADEPLTTSVLAELREIYRKYTDRTPVDCSCRARCSADVSRIAGQLWERSMRIQMALLTEIAAREVALSRYKSVGGR